MTTDETLLRELATRLEAAWNASDSVAWAAQFADDADFIHVLGGHFSGRADVERGHRHIFDTIYKGSRNRFTVEKVRFVRPDVAIVFLRGNLTWYLNGAEQHIEARPTLIAEKLSDGQWQIVTFQNTLITKDAVPTLNDTLAKAHPYKGDTPIQK